MIKNKAARTFAAATAAILLFTATGMDVSASGNISSVLPSAGVNYSLSSDGTALSSMKKDADKKNGTSSGTTKSTSSNSSNASTVTPSVLGTSLTALNGDSADSILSASSAATESATAATQATTEKTEKKIEDTLIVSQLYEKGLAAAINSDLDDDEKDD